MPEIDYLLYPIGLVQSSLRDRAAAPRQGDEGAPDAWLETIRRCWKGWTG